MVKTSVRNDERGFEVAQVLVILVVLAIIGVAGWLVMSRNKSSTTTSSTNKAATSAVKDECNKLYNDKDLCKFVGNFTLTNVAYKATFSTSQGTAGSSSTTIMLSDTKGNSSITSTTVGEQKSDFITLNGVSYMKDETSGVWWKLSSASPTTKPTSPTSDITFDTKAKAGTDTPVATYKKLGTEACGSLTCLKYQVVDPSVSGTNYFWFDTKDYRLQRWSSTDSNGATSDATFSYEKVVITAPSPVQDFPTTGLPAGQ